MQKSDSIHTNGGAAVKTRKPIKVPHVYVIICAIILFVAVCTWFVPPGQFDTQTMEVEGVSRTIVIPGTFHTLEEKHPAGLVTVLSSLHRGLVSGAEVTMLIFLVNGAFSMVLKTGAFNAFLGSLLRRFSSRAKLVIPVFFLTFAVLSSTFGMWNEYNGLIPVFMGLGGALGYDALAGFAILELGKGIGWSAATLNPFSVPVSQGIAGVPIFSGMGIRVVSFVIFSTLGIAYIFYYGQKVSKNPSKSLILGDRLDINFNREEIINTKTTKKQMLILLEILVSLVAIFYGSLKLGWSNAELAGIFVLMGVFAGAVSGWGPSKMAEEFLQGASTVVMGALVVGFAKAILVILQGAMIIDTIVFYASQVLQGMPPIIAAQGMLLLQTLINFFIPSSTGQAATVIPILAPLGDLLGVSRQVTCLAFQFGDGFSNILWPTCSLAISIGISGIPMHKWWKFFLPLFGILYIAQTLILSAAVLMGI